MIVAIVFKCQLMFSSFVFKQHCVKTHRYILYIKERCSHVFLLCLSTREKKLISVSLVAVGLNLVLHFTAFRFMRENPPLGTFYVPN